MLFILVSGTIFPISSLFCIVLYLLIRYACSRVTMHDMTYWFMIVCQFFCQILLVYTTPGDLWVICRGSYQCSLFMIVGLMHYFRCAWNFLFLQGVKSISSLFCIVSYLFTWYACSRVCMIMHDMPFWFMIVCLRQINPFCFFGIPVIAVIWCVVLFGRVWHNIWIIFDDVY